MHVFDTFRCGPLPLRAALFETTVSQEYSQVATTFRLEPRHCIALMRQAIAYTFASDETKVMDEVAAAAVTHENSIVCCVWLRVLFFALFPPQARLRTEFDAAVEQVEFIDSEVGDAAALQPAAQQAAQSRWERHSLVALVAVVLLLAWVVLRSQQPPNASPQHFT